LKSAFESIFLITFDNYITGILSKKGKLLKLKDKIELPRKSNFNNWMIKNTNELRFNKKLKNPLALELLNKIVSGKQNLPKLNYTLYFIKNGITTNGKRISNVFIKIKNGDTPKQEDIRIITDSENNILGYSNLGAYQIGGGISLQKLNLENDDWIKKNKNLIVFQLKKIRLNDLTNKYFKHKFIAKGSMGSVYLVTEKATGIKYALKFIDNQIHYLKEIQNLSYLENECNRFPCIHEVGVYNKEFGIIEELIEGQDLYELIEKDKIKLSKIEIEDILRDLSSDLVLLHSLNISHRDIKMENIVIDKDNKAKFIDFGLSCIGNKQCSPVGTLETMLPELAELIKTKNTNPIDNHIWMQADWYSLGVVMEELSNSYLNQNRKILDSIIVNEFIDLSVNNKFRNVKLKQWLLKYNINEINTNTNNSLTNLFKNLKL
jgi:tRNA A-37 threonylcarbamoyl transferase component Bud32